MIPALSLPLSLPYFLQFVCTPNSRGPPSSPAPSSPALSSSTAKAYPLNCYKSGLLWKQEPLPPGPRLCESGVPQQQIDCKQIWHRSIMDSRGKVHDAFSTVISEIAHAGQGATQLNSNVTVLAENDQTLNSGWGKQWDMALWSCVRVTVIVWPLFICVYLHICGKARGIKM